MSLKVIIHGSCVTRDMVTVCGTDQVEAAYYIARQTIPSVDKPVSSIFEALKNEVDTRLSSPFQQRMVLGDIKGNCLDSLRDSQRKMEADYLLIDLIDERLGIYVNQRGEVLTRSGEGVSINLYNNLGTDWKFVSFGGEEHLKIFKSSAAHYLKKVGEFFDPSKVFVLRFQWATHDDKGNPTNLSVGLSAAQANKAYEPYYEALEQAGFQLVSSEKSPLTDGDHIWGPTPFHYMRQYYLDMWDAFNLARRCD